MDDIKTEQIIEKQPETPIKFHDEASPELISRIIRHPHRKNLSINTDFGDDTSSVNEIKIDIPDTKNEENNNGSGNLIDEHLQEIQIRINAHSKSYSRFKKRDSWLSYPITLMSAFLSSSLVADSDIMRKINIAISAAILVTSITKDHLKYSHKAHSHDVSAKLYTSLLRSIEVRLVCDNLSSAEKKDIFKILVDQMSIIEQYETDIPNDINEETRKDTTLPRSFVINNIF